MTVPHSRVSAVMEGIESWHGENLQLPVVARAPAEALNLGYDARGLDWVSRRGLLTGREILGPVDAIYAALRAAGCAVLVRDITEPTGEPAELDGIKDHHDWADDGDLRSVIRHCASLMATVTGSEPFAVRLDHDDIGVPAVKVFTPGLRSLGAMAQRASS